MCTLAQRTHMQRGNAEMRVELDKLAKVSKPHKYTTITTSAIL